LGCKRFWDSPIEKEEAKLNELIASNPAARRAHEEFLARIDFQKQLVETRKKESLTQKQLAQKSGLSQQAISRFEKGSGWNLSTFIKYISGLGYGVQLKKLR